MCTTISSRELCMYIALVVDDVASTSFSTYTSSNMTSSVEVTQTTTFGVSPTYDDTTEAPDNRILGL